MLIRNCKKKKKFVLSIFLLNHFELVAMVHQTDSSPVFEPVDFLSPWMSIRGFLPEQQQQQHPNKIRLKIAPRRIKIMKTVENARSNSVSMSTRCSESNKISKKPRMLASDLFPHLVQKSVILCESRFGGFPSCKIAMIIGARTVCRHRTSVITYAPIRENI